MPARKNQAKSAYDVQKFADDYGIGRNTAYIACNRRAGGDETATPFPVYRICGRLVIPAEPYDRALTGKE